MPKDFSSYLSVPADQIERPKALPLGHFFSTIKSWKPDERNYAKAGEPPRMTPVVTVTFSITGPDDDVEPTEVPDDLRKVVATRDYDLTDERGLFALRQLAEQTCGMDVKGLSLEDVLNSLPGQDVKVYSEPRAGRNEGEFYTNISRVLSVD